MLLRFAVSEVHFGLHLFLTFALPNPLKGILKIGFVILKNKVHYSENLKGFTLPNFES